MTSNQTHQKDFDNARAVSAHEQAQLIRQLSPEDRKEAQQIKDRYVKQIEETRQKQAERWQQDFFDRLDELRRLHPTHNHPAPSNARLSAADWEKRLRHQAQTDIDHRNNAEITGLRQDKDREIDALLERENIPRQTAERDRGSVTPKRDFDKTRQR